MEQESSDIDDGALNGKGRRRQVAILLDWFARNSASQFCSYNTLGHVILGSTDEDAKAKIRPLVYQSRDLLRRDFGRELVVAADGARATVDGGDFVNARLQREVAKTQRQLARLGELAQIGGRSLPEGDARRSILADVEATVANGSAAIAAHGQRLLSAATPRSETENGVAA